MNEKKMNDAEWMQICRLVAVLANLSEADRRTWREEVLTRFPEEKDFCNLLSRTVESYAVN